MKTQMLKKGIYASMLALGLTSSAFAGILGTPANTTGKFYVGVFGGGGSTNSIDGSQYGTALFTEAEGGPLAVNAFGDTNSRSSWLAGVQTGYEMAAIKMDGCWSVTPALELEGYYLGNTNFTGSFANTTDLDRLPEHDFQVELPMSRTVFLANAVFSLNTPYFTQLHPYFGAGFGTAIVKISSADSDQVSPPELGVNHFNSSTTDTDTTFAGQLKLGLSYDLNPCIHVFAEYRWLYLSDSHFLFGSTSYAGHAETTAWQVKLKEQSTNLGTIGIRFDL